MGADIDGDRQADARIARTEAELLAKGAAEMSVAWRINVGRLKREYIASSVKNLDFSSGRGEVGG